MLRIPKNDIDILEHQMCPCIYPIQAAVVTAPSFQKIILSSKDWLTIYFNNGVVKIFLSWTSNIYMVFILMSQNLMADIMKKLFDSSGRFLLKVVV